MPEEPTEITLESVDDFDSENLTDDQTTFLTENQDDLSDEQKETFKVALEEKEEEDIDPGEVNVETRFKKKKKTETAAGDDDDDDTDPDDAAAIDRRVEKGLKPLQDQVEAQAKKSQKVADEAEVDAHIRENPEYKKYRGVILKHMKHPSYSNIPAAHIASIVASKDQQAIGAKKERKAARKVEETRSPGSSARKTKPGDIDWGKATKKQMATKKQEILDRSRE